MKRLYVFLFLGLFAFGAGAILMTVTADPAQACGYEDDCGGWEEPEWDDDCGCYDDHDKGDDIDIDVDIKNKVKVDLDLEVDVEVENNNVNNNTNNNTNNNVNNNNNEITVVIENNGDVNATANAEANAMSNASATARARLNSGNLRNRVFGEDRRGAGGTIVNAARAPISIGPLRVVVKEERVKSRAVRGVCLDAKGLEEAAYLSVTSAHVDVATGSGELMFCQMGDALVATIGEVPDGGGQPDYTHGQVIECLDGQSLHYGNEGRLTCGPSRNAYFTGSDRRAHVRYAEVFLNRKSSGYAMETTAYRGATTFNGGVGY